jgi:hypothetical protein
MKRKILFVLLMLSVVSLAMAKDHWRWIAPAVPAENVTVTGPLTIVQGSLAVINNGITYYVPKLAKYIGFIDTLKEGTQVTLEGAATASPLEANSKRLRVSKLTIGGRTYDLAPAVTGTSAQAMWYYYHH